MAKRSRRTATKASTRRRAKPDVEELEAVSQTVASASDDVTEFDPAAFRASSEAAAAALEAEPSEGELEISADLYAARDELIDWLGGQAAMAEARASAVTAGPTIGIENVLGVGVGVKESAGSITGELAVKVLVKEKLSPRNVASSASVPDDLGGIPTDVEETGVLTSFSYARRYRRPVPSGVSCGHPDITAGTIGCLVVLRNNRLALLSNNHVLADENNASIGDPVIQPGRIDGGTSRDLIGVLEAFTPINFHGTNLIDGAVAWTARSLVSARHVTYAMNPNPAAARVLGTVIKNGRTTQATTGWISAIDVDGVGVQYDGGVATFDNQIIIRSLSFRPFSQGGDSGSLIVTSGSKRPVGLLFAGSPSHTIANPIGAVMAQLGIDRFYAP